MARTTDARAKVFFSKTNWISIKQIIESYLQEQGSEHDTELGYTVREIEANIRGATVDTLSAVCGLMLTFLTKSPTL